MITRRQTFALTAASALASTRVQGANDRIGLGLIGAGGRGMYVMSQFKKSPEVEIRAVCDVFGDRTDKALTENPGAKGFNDHRKLLDQKGIDMVLIGTPDHWHHGTVLDAAAAKKDIYCEKPLTRLISEGPEMVRAVRVNNVVCQVGMQQRSGPVYLEAREKFVKSGLLGKISLVRCFWPSGPARPLQNPQAPQPSNLDWARYLGPVKWRDWFAPMYYNYRAFLEFGGGKLTDFGAHWMDVVHMFMGVDTPLAVSAEGGVFFFQDGRTAPDSIAALYEYPGGFLVQFDSMCTTGDYGIEFFGDKGRLYVNRNRYEFRSAERGAQPVGQQFPGDITLDHVRNFLDCVKSRKLPNADILIGHKASQASLLAVESYLLKRRVRLDPVREEVLPA